MSNKQLLKDAAKAAGINLVFDPEGLPRDGDNRPAAMNVYSAKLWNPIDDDGDALRLAVKLEVQVVIPGDNKDVYAGKLLFDAFEPVNGDPYAATRRAIVRAAAEIGRSKT